MDTQPRTAAGLARKLGTGLPRIHRLLDSEGVEAAAGRGRARHVDPAVEARLLRRIGAVPRAIADLDRIDMLVLAAVSRAGLGLESARAVARVAGVSPTAAVKSLRRLEALGLARRRQRRIVRGRPGTVELWTANPFDARWTPEIGEAVSQVVLPSGGRPAPPPARVPPRFGHLFWNADLYDLDPIRDGDFVASRLVTADDPDAWAWAAGNLPPSSVAKAARLRGLSPRRRALIENLGKVRHG